jgi:hypothetical protein
MVAMPWSRSYQDVAVPSIILRSSGVKFRDNSVQIAVNKLSGQGWIERWHCAYTLGGQPKP